MDRCPSCQSRWVYRRPVPWFARFAKTLTRWRPYCCGACGWRGWRPQPTARPARDRRADGTVCDLEPSSGLQPIAGIDVNTARHHDPSRSPALDLGDVTALQARRFIARVLEEQGLNSAGLARQTRLWRAAPWSLPAFALGMMLAFALFSGGDRVRPRESRTAAGDRPDLETIGRDPSVDEAEDAEESGPVPSRQPRRADARPGPLSRPTLARASGFDRPTARRGEASTRSTVVMTAARATRTTPPRYRGSLVIYSYPPGARVSVDGRRVGITPLALKNIRVGSRVVRVEAGGYEPWSAAARVVADRQTRVTAELSRGSSQ